MTYAGVLAGTNVETTHMKHKLKNGVVIEIPSTRSDWELYSSVAGADAFARKIAKQFIKAFDVFDKTVTDGGTLIAALKAGDKVVMELLHSDNKYGASDTEPRYHRRRVWTMFLAARMGIGAQQSRDIVGDSLW